MCPRVPADLTSSARTPTYALVYLLFSTLDAYVDQLVAGLPLLCQHWPRAQHVPILVYYRAKTAAQLERIQRAAHPCHIHLIPHEKLDLRSSLEMEFGIGMDSAHRDP